MGKLRWWWIGLSNRDTRSLVPAAAASGAAGDEDTKAPRTVAGWDAADDRKARGVEHQDLVAEPVHHVDSAVGSDQDALRVLAHRNDADDPPGRGVDHRDTVVMLIRDEGPSAVRGEGDRIGRAADRDGCAHAQPRQIDDGDIVAADVGGIEALAAGVHLNSKRALTHLDPPQDAVRQGVDDAEAVIVALRHIEPIARRIDRQSGG